MSRSRNALYGIGGIIGATLLVSPLVNWSGEGMPGDNSNTYDPTLSEMSCSEVDTQLALVQRPEPAKEPEHQEVAFLDSIQPSGGEDRGPFVGTDSGFVPASFNKFYGPTNFPPPKTPKPSSYKGLPSFHGPVLGIAPNPFPNPKPKKFSKSKSGGSSGSTGGAGGSGSEDQEQNQDQDEEDIVQLINDGTSGGGSTSGSVVTYNPPNLDDTGPDQRTTEVPEPASLGLLALGVGLLAVRRRRQK